MYLNLLLSSSNFSSLLVRQPLSFDLIERRVFEFENFHNYVVKSEKPFLSVKFELTLPFLNDLGKFRNRVLVFLYFFIFELLVGFKPLVSPIMVPPSREKNNSKRLKSLLSSPTSQRIDKFIFRRDLGLSQSSFFLMTIACFLSRHTYSAYTVPSRLIQVSDLVNSYRFKMNSGFSNLDLFSQFDEFILSRVFINFSFPKKFSSQLLCYFLSSFGLNLVKANNIISLNFVEKTGIIAGPIEIPSRI